MSPAVRRARLLAGLFCGVGVVALVPWLGWWPVIVFALVPAPWVALDRWLTRVRRPERLVAASLSLHTTLIAAGVGISGGVHSPLLPWVAIPVVTAAARFRVPVFLTGGLLATTAVILAAVLASSSALMHDPAPLIGVIVLLGALVVAQQPLLNAETRWRREAVLDPLTGLLNRQGLARRFRQLAEQARLTDQPVSLVAVDLDEFKPINDAHGHAQGDTVLKAVACELRKTLRSFELLYRLGGEELLLILPGTELSVGCETRRTRATCDRAKPAGRSARDRVIRCQLRLRRRNRLRPQCLRPPIARSTRLSTPDVTLWRSFSRAPTSPPSWAKNPWQPSPSVRFPWGVSHGSRQAPERSRTPVGLRSARRR